MTIQTQVDVYEKDLIETVQSLLENPSVYVVQEPTIEATEHFKVNQIDITFGTITYSYSVINGTEPVFKVTKWCRTTNREKFANNITHRLKDSDGKVLEISENCAKQIYEDVSKQPAVNAIKTAEGIQKLTAVKERAFLNKLHSLVNSREH